MSRLDQMDVDTSRAIAARDAYVNAFMLDVPIELLLYLPVSINLAVLKEGEELVREIWANNSKKYQEELRNPWKNTKSTAALKFIKWDNNSPQNGFLTGSGTDRPLGLPAPIKQGQDPDGVFYSDYPAVNEAYENASRTAEWVADEAVKQAMKDLKPVSREHLLAFNALADAKTEARTGEKIGDKCWQSGDKVPTEQEVNQLEKAVHLAEEKVAKAQAELKRLRANPVEGLRIVR